jgi:ATP-dependent Clp protease ATP-binding subunit ClpA
MRVVDKFLMQLEAQLHEKKVDALFTDKLKEWLGKKGFDPLMGARPMARLIQDTIRSALADELLFGRLAGAAASPSTWTTTARSCCSSKRSRKLRYSPGRLTRHDRGRPRGCPFFAHLTE